MEHEQLEFTFGKVNCRCEKKKNHSEEIFLFGEGVNFTAEGISRKFPQIKFSFDG